MIAGQLSWAAPFKDNGVDDIATECGHAPPPSLVARTMSCDIRELCGELRHLPSCHSQRLPRANRALPRTRFFPAPSAEIPHQRTAMDSEGEDYSPIDGREEYLAPVGNYKAVVRKDHIEGATACCRRAERESISDLIGLRAKPAAR